MNTRVYLDHNATSPLRAEAREALIAAFDAGNPSSAHAEGRAARRVLEDAREELAELVGAPRDGVVFTSGGTEANTWVVTSCPPGTVLATSRVEHPSITALARARDDTLWLDVTPDGRWARAPRDVLAASSATLGVVSTMLANHETGHRLDVEAVVDAVRALPASPLVHTDASQAFGRLPVDLAELGVDALTLCAHKLGGPLGVGALCLATPDRVGPMLPGGGQEGGLRGGTECAALAAGFTAAARVAIRERDERRDDYISWVARIRAALVEIDPSVLLNSSTDPERSLPNTLNVSFPGRAGSHLVHRFDLEGVAISHGSACASGSLEPSPVLLAVGHDEDRSRSAVRISLGPCTTDDDVARFIDVARHVVRDISKRNA